MNANKNALTLQLNVSSQIKHYQFKNKTKTVPTHEDTGDRGAWMRNELKNAKTRSSAATRVSIAQHTV